MPLPIEIVGLGRDRLRVIWDDEGHEGEHDVRDLRLRCRCAMCVDEMTGTPILDPRTVPADLRITAMQVVGNYGLQVTFSDGHATGIFRFADLLARCPCPLCASRGSR